MIWHVGYDGMAIPVAAETTEEAREKAKKYLEGKGYRINLITVSEASEGYLEWIENYKIVILQ